MKPDQYDYIIVGGGLAGITLAMHLHQLGRKLIIFEGTQPNISSHVAAGIFNPITGRKMVKTWQVDALFPYLETYYGQVETLTSQKFLHKTPIYRPFVAVEEQNEWMGKSSDEPYRPYIKQVHNQSIARNVSDPYGGIELNHSGFLDIPNYLTSCISHLSKHHDLIPVDFVYDNLIINNEDIRYGNCKARKIIFCEGVNITKNKFFHWLPLRPVKGEILYIKLPVNMDYILNRGVFVLPVGDGIYKVGSNYDRHDLTLAPTEKAKTEIIEKLKAILPTDFEIVDQVAGLRPATKDRRPFIGMHPSLETIGVFNGLGTKGVSLAPYWSSHFINHLESGKKLNDEVNISRYFSLYSELRELHE